MVCAGTLDDQFTELVEQLQRRKWRRVQGIDAAQAPLDQAVRRPWQRCCSVPGHRSEAALTASAEPQHAPPLLGKPCQAGNMIP